MPNKASVLTLVKATYPPIPCLPQQLTSAEENQMQAYWSHFKLMTIIFKRYLTWSRNHTAFPYCVCFSTFQKFFSFIFLSPHTPNILSLSLTLRYDVNLGFIEKTEIRDRNLLYATQEGTDSIMFSGTSPIHSIVARAQLVFGE